MLAALISEHPRWSSRRQWRQHDHVPEVQRKLEDSGALRKQAGRHPGEQTVTGAQVVLSLQAGTPDRSGHALAKIS